MTRNNIRRIAIIAMVFLVLIFAWPATKFLVINWIVNTDPPTAFDYLVIENWNGELPIFEEAQRVLVQTPDARFATIIFEESFVDPRKRALTLLSADAAGIDTARLRLIRVPLREPKTMNIADAVIDSMAANGITKLTLATAELHSARSRKAYVRAGLKRGVTVRVIGLPYEGITSKNWSTSATGLAMGFSEFIKRLYYELVVF